MSNDLVITATLVKSTTDDYVFMKIVEIIREINWKSWTKLKSYTFNYWDGIIIFNIDFKNNLKNNSFINFEVTHLLNDLRCKFDGFSFE